jgi:hypothetical protein
MKSLEFTKTNFDKSIYAKHADVRHNNTIPSQLAAQYLAYGFLTIHETNKIICAPLVATYNTAEALLFHDPH